MSQSYANEAKKPVPKIPIDRFSEDVTKESNPNGKDYGAILKEHLLDQDMDYPRPESVLALYQNGKEHPFLTRESISLWQGKQKSKKTTALALAVGSCLADPSIFDDIRFVRKGNGAILYFDCEQGRSYAARTMKLILKIADKPTTDRLKYFDLRTISNSERLPVIEAALKEYGEVSLVIIDGLVDISTDFMDSMESNDIIANLGSLASTYRIHIAGVLHQNKLDKNARGHLGSIASQKCEIEISAEVKSDDKAVSVISCVYSRDMPFEDFAIEWRPDSLPRIVQEFSKTKLDQQKLTKQKDEFQGLLDTVFHSEKMLNRTSLERLFKSALINTSKPNSATTVDRRIKDAIALKLIFHDPSDFLYRRLPK